MAQMLSFALTCHAANGKKILNHHGVRMSEDMATAINTSNRDYSVHLQQLRATDDFVQSLQQRLSWHATPAPGVPEKLVSEQDEKSPGKVVLRVAAKAPTLQRQTSLPDRIEAIPTEALKVSVVPFRFADLPYDLRHQVLEYCIERTVYGVFLPGNNYHPATGPPLADVARTGNRDHDSLATLVTLKQTTIAIHSGPGNAAFQKWLAKVTFAGIGTGLQTGFDAIHSLSFPYFSRFPYRNPAITVNNDIQMMLKCKNLRHVSTSWVYSETVENDGTSRSVATLRANYRLDGMLNLQNLQTLELIWILGYNQASDDTMLALGAWFSDEFAKKGVKVKVTCR